MSSGVNHVIDDVGSVASGSFTVDRDKAREKLRHFQLADPTAWLVEALRAAAVLGATRIDVDADTDDVHLRFPSAGPGAALSKADVDEIYGALLARNAPPARRHLAAALNGAMALGPRFIRVESTGGSGGVSLEMRPGKTDVIEELPAGPPVTHLHVRAPFGASRFVELFKLVAGTKRELVVARAAARFAPIPVLVNGALVSVPVVAPHRVDVLGRRARGAVLVELDASEQPGRIILLHRGMILEDLRHDWMPMGVVAVVEPSGLERDASLNAFMRGPLFDEAIDEVMSALVALGESALDADVLRRCALALAPAVLGAHKAARLRALSALLGKTARKLRTTPVFEDHRGGAVSLNHLAAELELHGDVLHVAEAPRADVTMDRLVVRASTDAERALLARAVGPERLGSATALIARQEQRARARGALLRRRGPTVLPPGKYLARRALDGAVRGEIGVRVHGPAELVATFFVDGALVSTVKMPSPIPGLSFALEAPFHLNDDFDGVLPDATLSRALRSAWAALPPLFDDAAKTYASWAKNADDAKATQADLAAARDPLLVFLAWVIDREGLWRAFAKKNNLDEGLLEPALPPVQLGDARVDGSHELSWAPLLPRVDGAFVALAWLPEVVPVVPHHVTRCSRTDAIRAGEVLRAILARRRKLEVLDEKAEREQRRALLLEQKPDRRALRGEGATVEKDGITSVLSFGGSRGLTLSVYTQGRAVHEVNLASFPAGPLRAVVEDPELLPAADGGVAPDDVRRLTLVALEGLPRLLLHSRFSLEWRTVTDRVLMALFPSPALRRAASVLEASPDGIADYLDLLELSSVAGIDTVTPLVELVLEVKERPSLANVREVAATLKTTLPKLAPPLPLDAELRLAVFGGRERILEANGRTLAQRVLDLVPGLGTVSFRLLGGSPTSTIDLRSLAAMVAAGRRLRAIPVELATGDGDSTILVLAADERRLLETFLGPLEDASSDVRAVTARRRFEAQAVEPPTISSSGHPVIVDIHEGHIRGQLGLVPSLQGMTRAHIRVLRGGRFVTSLDVSRFAPCSFQAVVDDPNMPMLDDWSAPASPGHLSHVTALCVRAADEGLVTVVTQQTVARDAARLLVLERMARRSKTPLSEGREKLILAAPLFDCADGHRVTLSAILTGVEKYKLLRYARDTVRHPDVFGVVLAPTVVELSLLSEITRVPVVDIGAVWERDARLEGKKAALAPLPSPPREPLASTSTTVQNGAIRAWLPKRVEKGEPSMVHAGLAGLEITRQAVDCALPGAVVVVTIPDIVDAEWTRVRLQAVETNIEIVLTALALAMIDRVETKRPPDGLREACRFTLVALLRKTQLSERWTRVREKLEQIPLFEATSGARITWRQVVEQRPERYEGLLRDIAGEAPAPTPRPAAAVPEPVKLPPPPPPPELVLEEKLKETLALVRLDAHAAAELARWPVSVERRGGKGAAVELTRKVTLVDADHAFVRLALDDGEDPAAFFMLCAVVYGAVNAHLGEVTDDHERAFLARLVEHASTAS